MHRYERSRKASHLDTVHYEVDMLEYALEKLRVETALPIPEQNMILECFLLHYRNLLEFFSGEKHRIGKKGRTADISVAHPKTWCGRDLSTPEAETLSSTAKQLLQKHFEDISQFLQHCTERRFSEPRDWDPQQMWDELKPTLEFFRKTFPRTASPQVAIAMRSASNSTTTFIRHENIFPKS